MNSCLIGRSAACQLLVYADEAETLDAARESPFRDAAAAPTATELQSRRRRTRAVVSLRLKYRVYVEVHFAVNFEITSVSS
jgi:hypothetical protein